MRIHPMAFIGMDINSQQEVSAQCNDTIGKPTEQGILLIVCQMYGLMFQDIKSKKRTANIVDARCLAIAAIKHLYPSTSLKQMGRIMHLHHTSIIYYHQRHKDILKYDIDGKYCGNYFDITDRLDRWKK